MAILEKMKNKVFSIICPTFDDCFKYMNIILIIAISFRCYMVSLQNCEGSIYFCFLHNSDFLIKLVIYYLIATISSFTLIFLSFHGYVTKLVIIPMIIFYAHCSMTYQGEDPANHGTINAIGLPVVFIGYFIIFELVYNISKCAYKKQFIRIIVFFLIVIITIVTLEILSRKACTDWDKGLGGVQIDNFSEEAEKNNGCYVDIPKRCWLPLLNGKIKFYSILHQAKCEGKANKKSEIVKYAPHLKDAKNIAYPLIKFKDVTKEIYTTDLEMWIIKRMYDLDKPESIPEEVKKYPPGAVIHFDEKGKGNLEIILQKNETLVQEKLKIINETKVKFDNILFLYIDALSRVQFLSKMPYTRKIFEKYYSNEVDDKYTAFQFLKYLNFEMKTPLNTVPMFMGVPFSANLDNIEEGTHINKWLNEHGYITAGTSDQCAKILYDISPEDNSHLHFTSFDHEIGEIFCDPNYNIPDRFWNLFKGINSMLSRCLYGKESYKHVMDFGQKFLDAYDDYPRKFLRLAFLWAHESSLEVIKLMDKDFSIFLQDFIDKYYDKNWAIFLVSDHGNGLTYYRSEDWRKEVAFGTLLLLLPKTHLNNIDKEQIRKNEQLVVTPYDIHNTLLDMIGYDKSIFNKRGNSTLNVVSAKFKKCEFFESEIKIMRTQYCTCITY